MLPGAHESVESREAVHLCFAYPGDLKDEIAAQRCLAILSDDERARWEKFRFDAGRREYLAAHALVRLALSRVHPFAPEVWRFQANRYGKPSIDPDCGIPPQRQRAVVGGPGLPPHERRPVRGDPGLTFNLSHSQGLCACIVANGEDIGVDVEHRDRAQQTLDVATRVFSVPERAQIESLPQAERLDRALSLWTLKEAYIKARGMGFSLPVQEISFLFDERGDVRLQLDPSFEDDAASWRFCLLDHAGHRVAIAARAGSDPVLKQWEFQPLFESPKPLPEVPIRWFPASA